ncbi:MAG TPA: HAMP domain-containing sensor histidine kinase, partial [Verrucomicrobiota bacterium]|nr:HAMP domain-containing sensor histidine kinase [Verrucomicrobiota bacterium]
QSISQDRFITIDYNSKNTLILTDPGLFKRVLFNLIKNALEAIGINKTVTIGAIEDNETVTVYIHNPTFIPERIQLQMFNRSFSTKGQGRGLGTYSAKLLTEGYLQGKVWFESTVEKGTTFYVKLPKQIDLDEEFFSSIND